MMMRYVVLCNSTQVAGKMSDLVIFLRIAGVRAIQNIIHNSKNQISEILALVHVIHDIV